MEDNFLNFCRAKIDFFDVQLLFFIKERVMCLQNLSNVKLDKFLKEQFLEYDENYSLIDKKWFLDFLSFDYSKENNYSTQDVSIDFFSPYLTNINYNIYFLLQNRFLISLQIGRYKKKRGLKLIDEQRWQSLLQDRLLQAKKLQLSKKLVLFLLEKIHLYSVALQK